MKKHYMNPPTNVTTTLLPITVYNFCVAIYDIPLAAVVSNIVSNKTSKSENPPPLCKNIMRSSLFDLWIFVSKSLQFSVVIIIGN